MSDPKTSREVIESFLSLVPKLDDEAWAARDRELADERAEAEAAAESGRRADQRKSLVEAGFPIRALEAADRADETADAIRRIAAWDPDAESILVLSGPAGTGKTVAAAWWAIRRKRPAMFLRSTTFAAASRYDQDKRDSWLKADALILDDLGTEYADAKGNYLVDLDEMLDTFYGAMRPLVITTNCDRAAFKERYGERIVDRIRECGAFYGVGGPSRRRRA